MKLIAISLMIIFLGGCIRNENKCRRNRENNQFTWRDPNAGNNDNDEDEQGEEQNDDYDDDGNHNNDCDNGQAPVPEPATIILLGGGLIGLVASRRKNKNKDLPA